MELDLSNHTILTAGISVLKQRIYAKLIQQRFKYRHFKTCWILTKASETAITVFIRMVEGLSVGWSGHVHDTELMPYV